MSGKLFFCFEVEKIQPQGGKNYPIVLSANEIAKCDRLKNKINTVKNCCEKSKCRVLINRSSHVFNDGKLIPIQVVSNSGRPVVSVTARVNINEKVS